MLVKNAFRVDRGIGFVHGSFRTLFTTLIRRTTVPCDIITNLDQSMSVEVLSTAHLLGLKPLLILGGTLTLEDNLISVHL